MILERSKTLQTTMFECEIENSHKKHTVKHKKTLKLLVAKLERTMKKMSLRIELSGTKLNTVVILQSIIFLKSLTSHKMMTCGTPLKLEGRVKVAKSLYFKFHHIFLNVHNFYIRYYFLKKIAP